VDDSKQNIETAQKLGFSTCRFTSPNQLEEELIQMGII
jgi:hypothetical protein